MCTYMHTLLAPQPLCIVNKISLVQSQVNKWENKKIVLYQSFK